HPLVPRERGCLRLASRFQELSYPHALQPTTLNAPSAMNHARVCDPVRPPCSCLPCASWPSRSAPGLSPRRCPPNVPKLAPPLLTDASTSSAHTPALATPTKPTIRKRTPGNSCRRCRVR